MSIQHTGIFLDTTAGLGGGRLVGNVAFPEKTTLKSAGWVVKASGDGLAAFSSAGDILTSAGIGAGGMSNLRAWWRIQRPDGGAEYCIQFVSITGANSPTARIKYSLSGFTGGAPSATVTPSATDEAFLAGSGTDAAPVGQIFYGDLAAGDATRRLMGCADSAPPYGFWFNLIAQGAAALTPSDHGWMLDPMQPWVPRLANNDAYVHYAHLTTAQTAYNRTNLTSYVSAPSGPFAWLNKNLSQAVASGFVRFITFPGEWSTTQPTNYDTLPDPPVAPASGRDLQPSYYVRGTAQAAPQTMKGAGTFLWLLISGDTVARICYNINGVTNAMLRIASCALPWNGTLPADIGQGAFISRNANLWAATDTLFNPQPSSYRMRAFDATLAQVVRWFAPFNDKTGTLYLGPGPLSAIVVDNLL